MKNRTSNKKVNLDFGIDVTNVFLLRGINPIEIYNKYKEEYYMDKLMPTSKINVVKGISTSDNSVGTDVNSEFFQFTDKLGEIRTVATTNHNKWIAHTLNESESLPLNPKYHMRCTYCRRKLDKQTLNGHESVGIPISLEMKDDLIVFNVDDHFCCYECAFTYLIQYSNYNNSYRTPLYMNSEQLLHLLFKLQYPDRELKTRPDWRLYTISGGILSTSEFHNNSHYYRSMESIVTNPCKRMYLKINDSMNQNK